jgi:ATP-dependent DNA helicase RecQ
MTGPTLNGPAHAQRRSASVPARTVSEIAALSDEAFGFRPRSAQLDAVTSVLSGRDTLAVLPTGAGKSLIYQLAGMLLGGLTVAVSPLIALQRDQLRSLRARRHPVENRPVRAELLNSTLPVARRTASLAAIRAGELDMVLLGPEQLLRDETLAALTSSGLPINLIVVDEAHLVSEWGQDFRPEYLRTKEVVALLGRPVLLALTATAAPPVQADITRALGMRDAHVLVADFDRPNITLSMRRAKRGDREADAIDDAVVDALLLGQTPALVYTMSHARCESVAARLNHDVLRAAAYHAGLSRSARDDVQDRFFDGSLDVVVATSAFGMGIDKPDVRTVVHAGVPSSVDDYYQEIGRAGRDGAPATAVLVYDERTIRIPRLLAARSRVSQTSAHAVIDALEAATGDSSLTDLATTTGESHRTVERIALELAEAGLVAVGADGRVTVHGLLTADAAVQLHEAGERRQLILRSRLDSMRHYAETPRCRRAELLAYFGEQYAPPCGNCDNDESARAHHVRAPTSAQVSRGIPVTHRLWGRGVLLSRDDHELVVAFDSVGYRHLSPRSVTDKVLTILGS